MLIRVDDISPTLSIKIRGDEKWLAAIEKNLQHGDKPAISRITGEIHLRRDSAGFIYGKGRVQHAPTLSCSRCAMDISWPLEAEINVSWRPPFESHTPRELALTADDLDVYFIEDKKVNLEELINDALQCALPEQVILRKDDSDDCGVCGISLLNDLVYGNDEKLERESPFAALKNLKS